MRKVLNLVVHLVLATLLVCSQSALSPGTSSGSEMASVQGTIQNEAGTPTKGAVVSILPAAYIPEYSSLKKARADNISALPHDTTDETGVYHFDNVDSGVYTIVAEKDSTLFVKIDSVVVVPGIKDMDTVGVAILLPPATIEGTVEWSDSTAELFVVVVGIDRYAKIDSSGRFIIARLPAGQYELQLIVKKNNEYISADTLKEVVLKSKETIRITIVEHIGALLQLKVNETMPCTLSVEPYGELPAQGKKFIWYKDSIAIDTTETGRFPIDSATIKKAGVYSCEVVTVDSIRWYDVELKVIPLVHVTFSGNGRAGGGATTESEFTAGMNVPLAEISDSLVNTGYTLTGWCTDSSCSETHYLLSDTLVLDTSNVTLYAVWEKNHYVVVVFGADSTVDSQSVLFGDTAITPAVAERQGFTFAGWYRDSAYTMPWNFAADSVTSATRLYAHWIQDTCTITIVLSPDSTLVTKVNYGAAPALPPPPQRTGVTFGGWYLDSLCTQPLDSATKSITANTTVYAKWVAMPYELTLQSGGTSQSTQTLTVSYGTPQAIVATPPPHYHFTQWSITSGTATIADSLAVQTTVILENGAASVSAVFTPDSYPLEIAAGTQGTVTGAGSITYGTSEEIAAHPDSGYIFDKWEIVSGSASIADINAQATTITLDTATVVRPLFKLKTFNVMLRQSAHGIIAIASDTTPVFISSYGTPVPISATADSAAGYHFVKWFDTTGNARFADEYSPTTTATVTAPGSAISAQFAINTYSVQRSISGTGTVMIPDSVLHDVPVAISATPAAGYSFATWRKASGTVIFGDSTNAQTTMRITNSGSAVQAVFVKTAYAITYASNGATGGSAPDTGHVTIGDTIIIGTAPALVRTGYTFSSWNSSPDGTGKIYQSGDTVIAGAESLPLYAQWQPDTFTLVYRENNGTGDLPPASLNIFGSVITIASKPSSLAQNGYAFASWNTIADGSGIAYAPGDSFTVPAVDDTLFAQWSPNTYTIVFDGNDVGVTGAMVPQTIAFAATANLTANGFVRTGWNFAGWATSAGGGVVFGDGVSYAMVSEGDTLFAQWTIRQYTVSFDARGGSAVGQQTINFGSHATEPAIPTKTDSLFIGWYRESAYTNLWTFAIDSVVSDSVLYAKWVHSDTVSDIDGNVYHTVTIGTQTWMVENLKTTKYNDGTAIPLLAGSNFITPGYCWYNDDISNKPTYGALYNWYTVNTGKLAPVGWHVPDTSEWNTLLTFLGGGNVAGGKLKEAGTVHWYSYPNDDATNETGFTALPGGWRDNSGGFSYSIINGFWWSATEDDATIARFHGISAGVAVLEISSFKCLGVSVRCIRDNTPPPPPPPTPILWNVISGDTKIMPTWDTVNGTTSYNLYYQSGVSVSKSAAVLVSGVHPGDTVTGLTNNTQYCIAVCAVNAGGESPLSNSRLATPELVTDIDGNVYTTVTIGTQTWMVENLKTTQYNDGTTIPLLAGSNVTTPGYCWNNNDVSNKATYGALYNWYAVNTGKLAPAGWHVPDTMEWNTLLTFLGGADVAGGKLKEAGTAHWNSPNTGASNTAGFAALPGSDRSDAGIYGAGISIAGYWWSSTESISAPSFTMTYQMHFSSTAVGRFGSNKGCSQSVRCIRDNTPPPPLPPAPALTYVIAGDSTIMATWDTVSNATSYNLYYQIGTIVSKAGAVLVSGVHPGDTITGLTNNTQYCIAVCAVNAGGESPLSNSRLATPLLVVDADGNVYTTVTIGTQTWMVENLMTTKYNDGTTIRAITDSTPGHCWYDGNIANKNPYGALYNWFAVETGIIAPTGWHVPDTMEWNTLLTFLGGADVAGGKLRETGTAHWIAPNEGATNETGFLALPGGYRNTGGTFSTLGDDGAFWSSTEYTAAAGWCCQMNNIELCVYCKDIIKSSGISIRCLRD